MKSDPSSTSPAASPSSGETGSPSGDGSPSLATVRETRPGDFADIFHLTRKTYPHDVPWREQELRSHLEVFPEGQLVAVDGDDRVIGMAASLRLRDRDYPLDTSWMDLTGRGFFRNHDPDGDMLYAAEVMVDPFCRGRGVGKALYAARRALARRLGVNGIRATARLRGYHRVAPGLDPDAYARAVVQGNLGDPTLSFQLRQGFGVRGVIRDFDDDPETLGFAAVIDWPTRRLARRPVSRVPSLRSIRHRGDSLPAAI